MEYVKIILKSGKDQSVKRFHPWIFSGAIKKMHGTPAEGDIVAVYSNKDEFLGMGHYQIGSIAVRIISFRETKIDNDFWIERFTKAYRYRQFHGFVNSNTTNVYRLIHAEGDLLPGLIIDVYNQVAVLQMHSIGMYRNKDIFATILQELYGKNISTIYIKSANTLPQKADIAAEDLFMLGNVGETEVREYDNRFMINVVEGQKTGFFIDQRENRNLLKKYAAERNVLNMFGYTGGFSVFALAGGAKKVTSVDSSKKAIDLTRQNIALNYPECNTHEGLAVDAFSYLDEMPDNYDLIVLDPPAFAKHQKVLPNALQGYKRLNQKAIEKIKSGGILFTFSCSQVVSKENFRKSVFAAAANTGRDVRIMHELGQPADHPVNIYHPESEYLKGLVVYVS